MKNSLFLLTLLTVLLTWSCKDDCKDVTCLNGGICVEGDCDCPDGFTGLDCGIEVNACILKQCVFADTCLIDANDVPRCFCTTGYQGELCDSTWGAKYLGRFVVTKDCGAAGSFFFVDIEAHNRFNEIVIENFHNEKDNGSSAKVVGQAISRDNLLIEEQFMLFGKVTGVGSISPVSTDIFSLNYTIIKDRDTLNCNAIFQRVL